MNDLSKCTDLIGRQVIVIDETQSKNNVDLHTITAITEEGWFFENYNGPTVFALDRDETLFIEGYKAYIHPDEVSIQLIKSINVMKKQFNFELFKQKMLQRIGSSYYDVCTDYFKDIKVHAHDEDLDQVELMVCSIRQMESCSEEQVKKIEESNCLMDILEITLFNDRVGNIFFEDEDAITELMGECYS